MSEKGKKCPDCGGNDLTAGGKCRACKSGKKNSPAKLKTASLIVDPCFGFNASITDEGYLQVQQSNQEGEITDTLVLSRPEFRQLVDKFGTWAAAC